jgi:L-lysine exporter family protein LysE/ArgO
MVAGFATAGALGHLSASIGALLRIASITLLAWYGISSFRRSTMEACLGSPPASRFWSTMFTTLSVTLFNPGVYLDTVVVLGSAAAISAAPQFFLCGAAAASFLWFAGLAYGSGRLAFFMRFRGARTALERISGALLIISAVRLALFPG